MSDDIKVVLEDILKALQGTGQGARGAAGAIRDLTTATRDYGGATRDAQDDVNDLVDGQEDAIDVEKRLADQRRKALKDLEKQARQITSLSEAYDVAKSAIKLYLQQNEKLAKKVQIATAAFKGAAAGAKLTAAAFKGIFSIGGSLIGMFADIGAAIISIPFKFFNHIFSKAKQMMSGGTEIAQSYENVRKVFGDTGSGLGKSVIDLGKNLTKGVITPGLSARRVFGDLSEAINYANEVASASPEAFQALSSQFSGRNGLEILAMAKGLGIANEELVGFMDAAIATGQPVEAMLTDVTKYAKGMGDAFGLNSKLISSSMAKAAKDVKHFANSSVKEIAQATVYAQKLGVSLENITGILDAFNTFEQAADNVSKLSQAFGVNLDAMKLLEAKTPDEALDQVKQAFAAAGKSADQMNRQELQLIASTVGMDEATVKKTLSMKNAGVSMSNVKGVANSLEKQTMDTSQALSRLSKDIEKMVKAGQPPEGDNFFDVFLEGVVEGIDRTGEMRALIKEVAMDINKVRLEGRKLGEAIMKSFPGFKEFIVGLTEKMKYVPSLFADIRLSVESFMKGIENGRATVYTLMEDLQGNIEKFMGGSNSKMMIGLTRMWEAAKKIIAQGINWISDKLKAGIDTVNEFFSGAYLEKGKGVLSAAASQLSPITEALLKAWEKLKKPLLDLLENLFVAAIKSLWEAFWELPWQVRWGAIALTFGPSLVGAFMNAWMTKKAGDLIANSIAKQLGAQAPMPTPTPGAGGIGLGGGMALVGSFIVGYQAGVAIADAVIEASEKSDAAYQNVLTNLQEASTNFTVGIKKANNELSKLPKNAQGSLDLNRLSSADKNRLAEDFNKGRAELDAQILATEKEAHNKKVILEAGFIESVMDKDKSVSNYLSQNFLKSLVETEHEIENLEIQASRGRDKIKNSGKDWAEAALKAGKLSADDAALYRASTADPKKQAEYLKTILGDDTFAGGLRDALTGGGLYDLGHLAKRGNVPMPTTPEELQKLSDSDRRSIAEAAIENYKTTTGDYDENKLAAIRGALQYGGMDEEAMNRMQRKLFEKFGSEVAGNAFGGTRKAQVQVLEQEDAIRQQQLEELDLGPQEFSITSAKAAITTVKDLATELDKNFDLEGTLKSIKEKFSKAFGTPIFDSDQVRNLKDASIGMKATSLVLDAAAQAVDRIKSDANKMSTIGSVSDGKTPLGKFYSGFEQIAKMITKITEKGLSGVGVLNPKKDVADLVGLTTELSNSVTNIKSGAEQMKGLGGYLQPETPLGKFWTGYQSVAEMLPKIAEKGMEAGVMETAKNNVTRMTGLLQDIKSIPGRIKETTKEFATVRKSIDEAITAVNQINKGLTTMDLKEKDVRFNFGKAAGGILSRTWDPIKTASAEIKLTVNVVMSATDVESALVRSNTSKIKAAITTLAGETKTVGPDLTITGKKGDD